MWNDDYNNHKYSREYHQSHIINILILVNYFLFTFDESMWNICIYIYIYIYIYDIYMHVW